MGNMNSDKLSSVRSDAGTGCMLRSAVQHHDGDETPLATKSTKETKSRSTTHDKEQKTKMLYNYGRRSTKSKCKPGLRKGKWTPEEEAYTNMLVDLFKAGLLQIEEGKSLRSFLSEKLNCEPMRITKKFAGSMAIGKQVFVPRPTHAVAIPGLEKYEKKLLALRRKFLGRLEQLPKRIETVSFNSSSFAKSYAGAVAVSSPASSPTSTKRHLPLPISKDEDVDDVSYKDSPRSVAILCPSEEVADGTSFHMPNTSLDADCNGASLLINFISTVHKNELATKTASNDSSESMSPAAKRSRIWDFPICT